MRRDVVSLRSDEVLGSVVIADGVAEFAGIAADVFAVRRFVEGDMAVARDLIDHGWSNGHTLNLGPVIS